MSQQAAKDWMKKVFSEPALAQQVAGLPSEEEMFTVARGAGYEFSKQEWDELSSHVEGKARAYAEEHGIEISDELTDEQLAAIAGGQLFNWILGSVFGYVGSLIGGVSGGLSGAAAGAAVGGIASLGLGAGAGAVVGAVIGDVAGAAAGAATGVGMGNIVGGWIDSAFGL